MGLFGLMALLGGMLASMTVSSEDDDMQDSETAATDAPDKDLSLIQDDPVSL